MRPDAAAPPPALPAGVEPLPSLDPGRGEAPALESGVETRHVVFRAGGERFALPLDAVREVVVPHPPFARVPRAAPAVRGAMNLRGRVVAVVELAPLLGLPPDGLGPDQGHVMVLDRGRRGIGVLVAGVLGVEAIPAPSAPHAATGGPAMRRPAEVRGAAVSVLDADRLEASAAELFGTA